MVDLQEMGGLHEVDTLEASKKFKHLFDLDEYVGICQNLETDEILIRISIEDGKLYYSHRVTYLDSRLINQLSQNLLNDEKSKNLRQKLSLGLGLAAVVAHVVSGIVGVDNKALGLLYSSFGEAFNKCSNYSDNLMNATEGSLSHQYQRHGLLVSDLSRQSQEALANQSKAAALADRVIQMYGRQSELISGSGS